ncbi:2-octaprenyl-6-methoxyphenyl hydroxylase [Exilibacterium tricleocarpae]|uniref:2-octaprenyl-6-methoxyphenyl hydroxylase n=1 Tax=Exilibacterium tricleocarpae TaxID=2591008 RepID=A0A545SXL2_9GAMM|nr:2-octaprenyl-6-methoxyphenyl hydroxylase [Exilibacterium tricleocarpae]TQV69700.1 2-octaprenyl-6-methoxyphenyl hydroxylase [Exilibacterium tricleocarpae]
MSPAPRTVLEDTETDIAIVGGGMVGATLALLLAAERHDWRVTLIEALPLAAPQQPHYQPSFDARSTAIAAGSAAVLEGLGVWSILAQHATPIRQVHVSDRGHLGGTLIDSGEHGLEALGYVVENAWLGSVLLQRLGQQDNIRCLAPATVEALRFDRRGAVLDLRGDGEPQRLRCRLAVVADGAQSPLRSALGIDVTVTDYHQSAVIANVAFEQPHAGVAYERFTERGPLAILPLQGPRDCGRGALVWTRPSARAEEIMALDEREFLQRLQSCFGFRLGRFTRAGQRHAYPLQLITAAEQVRSALAVMGNAAHFLHPVAGQGFNLALRDCAALAETLSEAQGRGQGPGELSVLQTYVERQARDQLLTTGFSDTITRLFSTSRLPAAVLRNLGFFGLDLLPPAKAWLEQQTMGHAGRRARLRHSS